MNRVGPSDRAASSRWSARDAATPRGAPRARVESPGCDVPTTPGARRLGRFEQALEEADIRLDGARPWDIKLNDTRLAARVRSHGLVALGDAYVDGWWDCDAIDVLFFQALRADLPRLLRFTRDAVGTYLSESFLNLQNRRLAARNVESHYNLGNDLFQATLDPLLLYTCGYWKNAANLDQAQLNKLDLVCRKAGIRPGMRVLDLGCGWGGFEKFAAERYGASVVGITLSTEQLAYASDLCRGLPVEFRLSDYRDVEGQFDRVVSMGMFEHIGPKNHRAFMRVIDRALTEDGLAVLQFFASRDSFPNLHRSEVNWISRHIFPGMVVPSLAQLGTAVDGLFVVEDLHNFGAHYDPTLMAWAANFEKNWPSIREKYGDRLYRTWRYYLLSAAGAFRARRYQLWQVVLSKRGVPGGYESVR